MSNITITTEFGICISCGICRGICPKGAVTFRMKDGMYYPDIDGDLCVDCGLCMKVCPGYSREFSGGESAADATSGSVLLSCNAWSKNETVRHKSASGGIVSTLVSSLLESGSYDVAFSVDLYDYSAQLKTVCVTALEYAEDAEGDRYPKSRYLPVSHENAVEYMKKNRTKKVILIGTPCAVHGLCRVIRELRLDRENYLMIGLFCDKVLNYNVKQYYEDKFCGGRDIREFHFKNKDSGGWPGDSRLRFDDGSFIYAGIGERMKIKDYFVPERCLYCIDKLNVDADISLGDNYTDVGSSSLGTNSVVVRTEIGMAAWRAVEELIDQISVEFSKIVEAQDMNWRLNNLRYGKLFEFKHRKTYCGEINNGVSGGDDFLNYEAQYDVFLKKSAIGQKYDSAPEKLEKALTEKKKGKLTKFFSRGMYFVKRKINRIKKGRT